VVAGGRSTPDGDGYVPLEDGMVLKRRVEEARNRRMGRRQSEKEPISV